MKKIQNLKTVLVLVLSLFILTTSCKKDKKPKVFNYKLNGKLIDCSKNYKISPRLISSQLLILGKNETSGDLSIFLKDSMLGNFDGSYYSGTLSGYGIYFVNSNDKAYYYSENNSKSYFNINVKKFDESDKEINFSAKLFVQDDETDSLIIKDGKIEISD